MLLSTDVVEEISDALSEGNEEYARMVLRDHETSLSCKQRVEVRRLFKDYKSNNQ